MRIYQLLVLVMTDLVLFSCATQTNLDYIPLSARSLIVEKDNLIHLSKHGSPILHTRADQQQQDRIHKAAQAESKAKAARTEFRQTEKQYVDKWKAHKAEFPQRWKSRGVGFPVAQHSFSERERTRRQDILEYGEKTVQAKAAHRDALKSARDAVGEVPGAMGRRERLKVKANVADSSYDVLEAKQRLRTSKLLHDNIHAGVVEHTKDLSLGYNRSAHESQKTALHQAAKHVEKARDDYHWKVTQAGNAWMEQNHDTDSSSDEHPNRGRTRAY